MVRKKLASSQRKIDKLESSGHEDSLDSEFEAFKR